MTRSASLRQGAVTALGLGLLALAACQRQAQTAEGARTAKPAASDPVQATANSRAAADIATQAALMKAALDLAVSACLSNETSTEALALRQRFGRLTSGVQSTGDLEKKVQVLRGASRELPFELQGIENQKIRECMKTYTQPVLAVMVERYQAADNATAWPEPVNLRLRFQRTLSADPKHFTDQLLFYLPLARREPLNLRLSPQDPRGLVYYQYGVPYPAPGDVVRGTIVAETLDDASLSAAPPTRTQICFQRPARLPTRRAEHDVFECTEGADCKPGQDSTGWLQACPAVQAEAPEARLWKAAWDDASASSGAASRVRWVAPSLAALAGRTHQGVGYTVFTIATDAFRTPDVVGVEFGVRVNGTPVEEAGLPAELRPLPNHPHEGFSHNFALQTLNFAGAHGGCDVVEVSLRPLLSSGRKGPARTTRLAYVALRDVAKRTQPMGSGQLTWLASYITPQRDWRHIAMVHSYIYSTADGPAGVARAAGLAAADKRWLDGAGLAYKGQRVVGVVRPPRTVQPDGTAAFGLGAGLVQPTGQVRFTFSEGDARQLAAFMIAQRTSADARQVIAPERYIFQAVGGSRTAPGVCESVS